MNRIELHPEIRPLEGGQRELHVSISIDGERVGDRFVLDWRELYLTIRHPGEFFFWTSRNGEPLEEDIQDCVFVERRDDAVVWKWLSPISMSDLADDDDRLDVSASFKPDEYERALRQGWWSACSMLRANPGAQVYPRGFGEAGLLGLEAWAKSDAAKPFQPIYGQPHYG